MPQGSLLGLRLYMLMILQPQLNLYADDTTAFVIGNNTHEVVELLNILFDELSE